MLRTVYWFDGCFFKSFYVDMVHTSNYQVAQHSQIQCRLRPTDANSLKLLPATEKQVCTDLVSVCFRHIMLAACFMNIHGTLILLSTFTQLYQLHCDPMGLCSVHMICRRGFNSRQHQSFFILRCLWFRSKICVPATSMFLYVEFTVYAW